MPHSVARKAWLDLEDCLHYQTPKSQQQQLTSARKKASTAPTSHGRDPNGALFPGPSQTLRVS